MMTTTIREKPILFSAPMVRAILDGRKTMTRRVVKCKDIDYGGSGGKDSPEWNDPRNWGYEHEDGTWSMLKPSDVSDHQVPCPYGAIGDRLWVREAFDIVNDPAAYHVDDGEREDTGYQCKDAIRRGPADERWVVDYAADENCRVMDRSGDRKWKPSIHMPRWASRLTLEITGIRVERVQDIENYDAMAEGFPGERWDEGHGNIGEHEPREQFRELWDKLNGPRGFGWESNPWVWVLEFRRIGP